MEAHGSSGVEREEGTHMFPVDVFERGTYRKVRYYVQEIVTVEWEMEVSFPGNGFRP